jgi:N-acetyl-alpha-D-muramate 1-phosphate uridylyltransferase
MTVPATAMVLAAGLGTRMRPLTDTKPKPLIEVAGRSMLDRILDHLAAAGVGTAVVNLHHLGGQIRAHLANRQQPRIVLSDETDRLLETGGGVCRALPLLGPAPFFVLNGDVLWQDGVKPTLLDLASFWRDAEMDALLLMHPTGTALGYEGLGDFLMDQHGRLVRRSVGVAPFLFAGIQILHPRLFADCTPEPFSLNRLYDRAAANGRLYGARHLGRWMHIGTPAGLAEAELALKHGEH